MECDIYFNDCALVLNCTSRFCYDGGSRGGCCPCGGCGSYALFVGVVCLVFRSGTLSSFYSAAGATVGEMDCVGLYRYGCGDMVVEVVIVQAENGVYRNCSHA